MLNHYLGCFSLHIAGGEKVSAFFDEPYMVVGFKVRYWKPGMCVDKNMSHICDKTAAIFVASHKIPYT